MQEQQNLDFVCQAGAKGCDTQLQKDNVVSHPMFLLWVISGHPSGCSWGWTQWTMMHRAYLYEKGEKKR